MRDEIFKQIFKKQLQMMIVEKIMYNMRSILMLQPFNKDALRVWETANETYWELAYRLDKLILDNNFNN